MQRFSFILPGRSGSCTGHGEELPCGKEIISVLVPVKDEEYERRDFCLECWEATGKEAYGRHPFWKAVVPEKEKKAQKPLSTDACALQLLQNKLSEATEESQKAAYVIALYLERREKLIKRQERRGVYFFELPDTEEIFKVERKSLLSSELIGIEKELSRRLQEMSCV